MKKALLNTRVMVKLRKSDFRDEWYLYVESYPVIIEGKDKPQRVREYVNRTITTPIWDKNRRARTLLDGKVTYKPKRDLNGIILCKSKLDQDSCMYADNIRQLRQREYDTINLYSDNESAMLEQKAMLQSDYISYFEKLIEFRHMNSTKSTIMSWYRVHSLMKKFTNNEPIKFADIDIKLIEQFRTFLLNAPTEGNKKGTISKNTASSYFAIFKAGIKQAFIDGYLLIDIAAKVKGISNQESRKEYLTIEELNILANTPCKNPIIRRAALFSALTGLRHSDIQKLKWSEIEKYNNGYRLNFTQKKTKGVEYMPISEQAYNLCGKRREPERLVFEGLPDPQWISGPLSRWIVASGITKHITFHCFRHTYATLQLANGTDIYTVSKMLGHTNVRTTQVYAKVVDEKKEEAADTIKLNLNPDFKE